MKQKNWYSSIGRQAGSERNTTHRSHYVASSIGQGCKSYQTVESTVSTAGLVRVCNKDLSYE